MLCCSHCGCTISIPVTVIESNFWGQIKFNLTLEEGDPACAIAFEIEIERVAPFGFIYAPSNRTMKQYHLHPKAMDFEANWDCPFVQMQLETEQYGPAIACGCGALLGAFKEAASDEIDNFISDAFVSDEQMTKWILVEQ